MTPDLETLASGLTLTEQLAAAEALAENLRKQIAVGPCREFGHTWRHIGGRNAGCCYDCGCSIPVHVCEKCGDCDYGDNSEANEKIADCADRNQISRTRGEGE